MKFELEPYNRGASNDTLLDDLRSVARSLGKDYVTKDEYNERGRWCTATFQKRFGSWCKAHELAGLRKIKNCDVTAEDCLADIERVAEKLGKTTLSSHEYERYGKFNRDMIRKRCGSWKAAVERLGIIPCPLGQRISDEDLFQNLERVWEALGRQPRSTDFVKPLSRYSYPVYPNRFGSFRKALEAFVASFESREPGQFEVHAKEDTDGSASVAAPTRHRTSRTISWRMRFLVMRRDNFKCCICGASPALNPGTTLVIDHVVPWTAGGETVVENLQTLCEPCNGGKSNLAMNADRKAIDQERVKL